MRSERNICENNLSSEFQAGFRRVYSVKREIIVIESRVVVYSFFLFKELVEVDDN